MYGCSPDAGGMWSVILFPFNITVFYVLFGAGKFKQEQRLFVI